MSIRALLFDFDGLILDTETPIWHSWEELFASQGGRLEFADFAGTVGTLSSEDDFFTLLEGQIGHPLERQTLSAQRWQREAALIQAQPVLPGVVDYLQDARRLELRVGLASSSSCAWVTGHLQRLRLADFFDSILASDDVRRVKPDPELYLAVLRTLNVQPGEALVLEDSPPGIQAARGAGLFCVAVPNTLTRQLSLEAADMRLESLAELSLEALLERVEARENGRRGVR